MEDGPGTLRRGRRHHGGKDQGLYLKYHNCVDDMCVYLSLL